MYTTSPSSPGTLPKEPARDLDTELVHIAENLLRSHLISVEENLWRDMYDSQTKSSLGSGNLLKWNSSGSISVQRVDVVSS